MSNLKWGDWFNNRQLLEPIGNIPPAEKEPAYQTTQRAGQGGRTLTNEYPRNPGRFNLQEYVEYFIGRPLPVCRVEAAPGSMPCRSVVFLSKVKPVSNQKHNARPVFSHVPPVRFPRYGSILVWICLLPRQRVPLSAVPYLQVSICVSDAERFGSCRYVR